MQKITIVSALAVLLCIGVTEAEAADCKVGSQQTLTGSMSDAVDSGDGNWIAMNVKNAQPCSVEMLTGKGKVPAGCGFSQYFGKKFTATGVVEDLLGVTLRVTSIRCSGV